MLALLINHLAVFNGNRYFLRIAAELVLFFYKKRESLVWKHSAQPTLPANRLSTNYVCSCDVFSRSSRVPRNLYLPFWASCIESA